MKLNNLKIQEYLSLGYIYLVVLGIVSDAIYFKFLGVDILNYATILDVLITPINIIVHDVKVLFYFTLTAVIGYYIVTKVSPGFHFKFRGKKWYKKLYNVEKLDQKYSKTGNYNGILLIALLVLALFLGFGVGRGSKMKSRITNGNITPTHKIIFNDGDLKELKIVGQNSSYVFYVGQHDKEIVISPIVQNIKEIKKISKK